MLLLIWIRVLPKCAFHKTKKSFYKAKCMFNDEKCILTLWSGVRSAYVPHQRSRQVRRGPPARLASRQPSASQAVRARLQRAAAWRASATCGRSRFRILRSPPALLNRRNRNGGWQQRLQPGGWSARCRAACPCLLRAQGPPRGRPGPLHRILSRPSSFVDLRTYVLACVCNGWSYIHVFPPYVCICLPWKPNYIIASILTVVIAGFQRNLTQVAGITQEIMLLMKLI